jgi:proline dehydrogenase
MQNPHPSNNLPDFQDTKTAFAHQSAKDLRRAAFLFKLFEYPFLVKFGPTIASFCLNLKLPIKRLIKKTIFAQFCGGETIKESREKVKVLGKYGVKSIMDYSVEGEENEQALDHTCKEILKTVEEAQNNQYVPFSVFKPTGIARFALLEKVSNKSILNKEEEAEWERACQRVDNICEAAFNADIKLMIDAEESWIQPAIDDLVMVMSAKYNTEKVIVYNTLQMYRHDRFDYMKKCIENSHFKLGFKLVRGAYMEKERERAQKLNYPDPIQPSKEATDTDYNAAIDLGFKYLDKCALLIGTHNEKSCLHAVQKMQNLGIDKQDERVYFSQLLGMSDNISFNLAANGYLVVKYVPYGPVKSVLPYLSRRAEENSSVKGQSSRELAYIHKEMKRRQG